MERKFKRQIAFVRIHGDFFDSFSVFHVYIVIVLSLYNNYIILKAKIGPGFQF